jgi:hypothetical protein
MSFIASSPIDVWNIISEFTRSQDLLNLGYTCKKFRDNLHPLINKGQDSFELYNHIYTNGIYTIDRKAFSKVPTFMCSKISAVFGFKLGQTFAMKNKQGYPEDRREFSRCDTWTFSSIMANFDKFALLRNITISNVHIPFVPTLSSNTQSVTLWNTETEDISGLMNVPIVTISSCIIEDFTPLVNVVDLRLIGTGIPDVSFMKKLTHLQLLDELMITKISNHSHLQTLSLSGCLCITTLSGLSSLVELNAEECLFHTFDVSETLKQVELYHCENITNLPNLNGLDRVKLIGLNLESVFSLKGVSHVELDEMNLTNFSLVPLKDAVSVTLSNMVVSETLLMELRHNKCLNFDSCVLPSFADSVDLKIMTLYRCVLGQNHREDFPGLFHRAFEMPPHLETLYVHDDIEIIMVHGLPFLKNLYMEKIRRVMVWDLPSLEQLTFINPDCDVRLLDSEDVTLEDLPDNCIIALEYTESCVENRQLQSPKITASSVEDNVDSAIPKVGTA